MQSSTIIPRPPLPLFHRRRTTIFAAASNLPNKRQPKQKAPSLKHNLERFVTGSDQVKADSSLKGSDILHAMQRAAAAKKYKKNKPRTARRLDEAQDFDYDNVRPINVSSDWMERIEELERRFQELKARYHF